MQNLDNFKNEMELSGKNVYVGHRYVPKIMGEWDNTQLYEPLSIVQNQGGSFTSRQYVPVGVDINNEEFWVSTGSYNAQIEHYRQDVADVKTNVTSILTDVGDLDLLETDLKSDLVTGINSLNNDVINLKNDDAITPDNFEGTDFDKVQSAINEAIAQNKGIKLTRTYDVTSDNSLKINKSGSRWTLQFYGLGGGLKKTNTGFMFDTDDYFAADINFNNVRFEGTANNGMTLFNGDKIIIINTIGCVYSGVDKKITAAKYIQSIRGIGDRVTGGSGFFIETPAAYDYVEDSTLVEVRESFFKQTIAPVGQEWTSLYGTRFDNCVIEGLTGTAIQVRRTETLAINGLYFEKNTGGNIVFDDDSILSGISIENVQYHEDPTTLNPQPLIKWGGTLTTVKTENNRANNAPVHDTTNVTNGYIFSYRDKSGYNSKENIDENKRVMKRDTEPWTRVENGTNTATVDNIIKLSKNLEIQTVLPNESKKFSLEFNRDLYVDDIITVQIHSSEGNELEYRYVRNPSNKKLLDVTIKNTMDTNIIVSIYATVLKFERLGTQKG